MCSDRALPGTGRLLLALWYVGTYLVGIGVISLLTSVLSALRAVVVVAEDRERLRAALDAAGVGTDVHYPIADHRQPAWSEDYADVRLPVTEHAVQHVLTVPCFPELTEEEVARVCEVLRDL
jgi:dTDP-4-amino-4,6-dideoxygalactose transaminase